MNHRTTPTPCATRSAPARLAARLRRLGRCEDGSQLVELSVAMALVTTAVVGVAGAMNLGITAAGSGAQRSSAASLASERIERTRNYPYEQVALDVQPTHSTDPEHPDFYVTDAAPPTYDVNRDGSLHEPIVVGGSVRHVEDPVVRGTTELYVYQYVTWVDDAGVAGTQNYKRVTVVVTWRNELNGGTASRITLSTFVGDGTILIPQSTPTPATPAPDSSPAPSAAPQGGCEGDTQVPTGSMQIMSGTGGDPAYTASTTVQVRLEVSDSCPSVTAQLSNDGSSFTDVGTLTPGVAATVAWAVPSGDGSKTIYVRFRDAAGNVSLIYQGTVVLDQTLPTTPSSLVKVSCSLDASFRTVELTWGASSDTNLAGYRLYRSVDSAAYSVVATTATTSGTDTTKKTVDTVRYLVRAYDHAGNESADSNGLTYAKNSC